MLPFLRVLAYLCLLAMSIGRSLMRSAEDLNLNIDKEHDLVGIAQFHYNERGGRGTLNQLLINEFTRGNAINENHRILSRLPIQTFWTTNYDNLIETALTQSGKRPDVKITTHNLSKYSKKRCNSLQNAWRYKPTCRCYYH